MALNLPHREGTVTVAEAERDAVNDTHYILPLYTSAEAARILRVPSRTFRNWATGYVVNRVDTRPVVGEPIVTTADPRTPRGPSVPFVGLAEAYMLSAFRGAGVPLQRIRPAIRWLQDNIGLEQALANERLQTDGAEIL